MFCFSSSSLSSYFCQRVVLIGQLRSPLQLIQKERESRPFHPFPAEELLLAPSLPIQRPTRQNGQFLVCAGDCKLTWGMAGVRRRQWEGVWGLPSWSYPLKPCPVGAAGEGDWHSREAAMWDITLSLARKLAESWKAENSISRHLKFILLLETLRRGC